MSQCNLGVVTYEAVTYEDADAREYWRLGPFLDVPAFFSPKCPKNYNVTVTLAQSWPGALAGPAVQGVRPAPQDVRPENRDAPAVSQRIGV